MKDLAEIYKGQTSYFSGGYHTLIESTGVEIVDAESDNDYSGDTYMLVKEGERYGWLVFGWGSCSGCDAFAACETLSDLDNLRQQLYANIEWGTLSEVVAFAHNAHDVGRFYADASAFKTMLDKLDTRLASCAT